MTIRQRVEVAGRSAAALVCVLTSLYAVLVYIPFTFIQFVQSHLVGAIDDFVRFHTALLWAAAVGVIVAEWRQIRLGNLAAMFLALAMAAAAGLSTWRPVLSALGGGPESLAVALIALAPVVLLSALDARAVWFRVDWRPGEYVDPRDDDGAAGRLFVAGFVAALAVCVLYVAIAGLRGGWSAPSGVMWSVAGHLVVFGGVFVVVRLCRGLASSAHSPSRREFFLLFLVVVAAIAAVFYSVVFAALSFSGRAAVVVAAALALAIASVWASTAILIRAASRRPVTSGIELWLAPSGRRRGVWMAALSLIVLAAAAGIVTTRVALMDWNFLVQKLAASAVWFAVLAAIYAALPPFRLKTPALVMVCALPAILFGLLEARGSAEMAAREAGINPSFRLIHDALSPGAPADPGLYDYLASQTNIARDRLVAPVEIDLVSNLRSSGGPQPNIVVLVIDSLRRDYVSPFNPAVTFTPAIDAFARESLVFSNAFSRYGATGLSEPSIWVGGMIVHKQYVTPFAPMNTLAKLLAAEGYRPFVSVDTILRQLFVPPPANLTPLDANVANKDYDLCRTLAEISLKIDARPDARPFFAYTQPQNIHISTLTREGNSVSAGESYPGFHAATASRVKRMDQCFGAFINGLKHRQVFDNTIIVLTSDHGDSLGEDGRWGHAYTVFPEILRIPLMLHVPPSLMDRFSVDTARPAFSTDITPTLYSLLGHPPTVTGRLFGRSLLSSRESAYALPRGDLVVASSYGSVYGLLSDEGRRLYIMDGVNFQEYAYDLTRGLVGQRAALGSRERADAQAAIRAQVAEIGRLYGVGPATNR